MEEKNNIWLAGRRKECDVKLPADLEGYKCLLREIYLSGYLSEAIEIISSSPEEAQTASA